MGAGDVFLRIQNFFQLDYELAFQQLMILHNLYLQIPDHSFSRSSEAGKSVIHMPVWIAVN